MGPMTWDAIATFVTGLGAVSGAVVVGLRQVGITREQTAIAARQADILGEQTKLEKLSFHETMFDRRMEVYDGAHAFLSSIIQHATPPSHELERTFVGALQRSRFLYRPAVYEALSEIWKKGCEFRALKATMDHTYETQGHYGDGNPDKEAETLQWFWGRTENLPELFGDELQLGQG